MRAGEARGLRQNFFNFGNSAASSYLTLPTAHNQVNTNSQMFQKKNVFGHFCFLQFCLFICSILFSWIQKFVWPSHWCVWKTILVVDHLNLLLCLLSNQLKLSFMCWPTKPKSNRNIWLDYNGWHEVKRQYARTISLKNVKLGFFGGSEDRDWL